MSLVTSLQNLRTQLVEKRELMNAQYAATKQRTSRAPMFGISFALAFAFMLMALAVPAVSAGDLNDSISPILADMVELFTPLLSLIIAAVPLIIAIALIGFVIGILDGILGKLRV